mgnify:FL=1
MKVKLVHLLFLWNGLIFFEVTSFVFLVEWPVLSFFYIYQCHSLCNSCSIGMQQLLQNDIIMQPTYRTIDCFVLMLSNACKMKIRTSILKCFSNMATANCLFLISYPIKYRHISWSSGSMLFAFLWSLSKAVWEYRICNLHEQAKVELYISKSRFYINH